MQNTGVGIHSFFALIAFFACIIIRILSLSFNLNFSANYVFYIFLFSMLVFIAIQSFKGKDYSNAFESNNSALKPFAICSSAGFLIEFVYSCINIYNAEESKYINIAENIILIAVCVFALLSALYFSVAALSFGDTAYDFRKLKLLHFAPIAWAFSKTVLMIPDALSFKLDADSVLKYTALVFGLLFFFSFAYEIENKSKAKSSTVFFAGAFSYLGLLYFMNRMLILIFRKAQLNAEENIFALSLFLICLFVHFFKKNILLPTE